MLNIPENIPRSAVLAHVNTQLVPDEYMTDEYIMRAVVPGLAEIAIIDVPTVCPTERRHFTPDDLARLDETCESLWAAAERNRQAKAARPTRMSTGDMTSHIFERPEDALDWARSRRHAVLGVPCDQMGAVVDDPPADLLWQFCAAVQATFERFPQHRLSPYAYSFRNGSCDSVILLPSSERSGPH